MRTARPARCRPGAWLLGALLGCAAPPGLTETVYVTDQLILNLHAGNHAGSRKLGTVRSDAALEVLQRGTHFTKVRTADGTVGWARSAYLVSTEPARLRLDNLAQQNQRLTQDLARAREQLAHSTTQLTALQKQAAETASQTERHTQTVTRLRQERDTYQARLAALGWTVPGLWLVLGSAACLVLGFWAGYRWLDYRIRRRHGGFRVY